MTAGSLQPIQIESLASDTIVFSPLPEGKCLRELIAKRGKVDPRKACQIAIGVADALAALHERSLIHGAVQMDRVWISSSGEAFLLRDPSGPAVNPLQDRSHRWIDDLEPPELYCAPELTADDKSCDEATDIYSLGCLLYRLVVGHAPYSGNSIAEVMAAHASETPSELVDAVQKGEAGDPLFRVIAFAMAKNPSARFGSARQFAAALAPRCH